MANLMLPGNPRYQPKSLVDFFGYDNLYGAVAEVEIATLRTLAEIGVISATDISLLTPELEKAIVAITTTEVDRVEKTDTPEFGKATKHDIRAWVRIAQSKLPVPLRRWVHVPLTSYDALDTARAIQFSQAHQRVIRPSTNKLIGIFADRAEEFAETVQIGRTHLKHALPITVGFWLATILSRIIFNADQANSFASGLVGKISGAVGAYNAQVGLGIAERCGHWHSFEERVLEKVGLKPARISTQILPPEPLAYYLFSLTMMSASLGQFGRDGRNLMRTEVGEIGEPFEQGQVGSSTMAHKRNPINFENSEGMWLKNKNEFGKVFDTLISDHQRDLVGSCIARDFPTIVVNLVQQLDTLLRKDKAGKTFLERISVDEEACGRNFKAQGDTILAEPIYIALQMAGYDDDAHELVNHTAMPYAKKHGVSLLEATKWALTQHREPVDDPLAGPANWGLWEKIPPETLRILEKPEVYTGAATSKCREIVAMARLFVTK